MQRSYEVLSGLTGESLRFVRSELIRNGEHVPWWWQQEYDRAPRPGFASHPQVSKQQEIGLHSFMHTHAELRTIGKDSRGMEIRDFVVIKGGWER